MKDAWKEYFYFNKTQRNGILVLSGLIAIFLIYLFIADYFPVTTKPVDFSSFKADLEKAGIKSSGINGKGSISLAHIDINSADTSLLKSLDIFPK